MEARRVQSCLVPALASHQNRASRVPPADPPPCSRLSDCLIRDSPSDERRGVPDTAHEVNVIRQIRSEKYPNAGGRRLNTRSTIWGGRELPPARVPNACAATRVARPGKSRDFQSLRLLAIATPAGAPGGRYSAPLRRLTLVRWSFHRNSIRDPSGCACQGSAAQSRHRPFARIIG
jgi:hypothetical protein